METRRWALFSWAFLTIGILLGRLVELRGARLVGRLGLGPGRERLAAALAHRHRLHPLGAGPGAARACCGSGTSACSSRRSRSPSSARSSPDRASSTRCTPSVTGRSASWFLGFFGLIVVVSLGLIGWRGDRLRSPGVDRLAAVARGRVPGQQRVVHRVRLRRAARHRLPADRRGARRSPHRRRCALLRSAVDADRARPAVPDGGGAGAAVAQGVDRAAAAPAVLAGLVSARAALVFAVVVGADRLGAARWRSDSPASRRVRRCASSCWPLAARDGAVSSGGPTAA